MDNTMNFSAMTRLCHNIMKASQAYGNMGKVGIAGVSDTGIDGVSFSESLAKKNAEIQEYKRYIYDKIEALPIHSSNVHDSISVHISDAGFETMMNDSEYEKWVLDTLEKNFMCPDQWSGTSGGKFVIFRFGADRNEFRSDVWRIGFRGGNGYRQFNEKSEDSFWERREKRRKLLKEELEEMQEKKAVARQMAKSQYYAQMAEMTELAELKRGENMTDVSGMPLNYDAIAMQIFSTFKTSIMLESLRGKKFDK